MPVRVLRNATVGSESLVCPPGFTESDTFKSFFWGCKLSEDQTESDFKFPVINEDDDEDRDFVIHSLILKQIVLGSEAADGEMNVVELETTSYQEETIKQPIACLCKGGQTMSSIDFEFRQLAPVKLRLVTGKGPVYVSGMHQTEIPHVDEADYGMFNDTEAELTEEESPAKALKKGIKRKARTVLLKKKQARSEDDEEEEATEESLEEGEEESMEEDQETEETEEDGSQEDDEDEDEEDDDEEEEDEEEDAPKKTKKASKGKSKKVKQLTPKELKKINGSAKKATPRSSRVK